MNNYDNGKQFLEMSDWQMTGELTFEKLKQHPLQKTHAG